MDAFSSKGFFLCKKTNPFYSLLCGENKQGEGNSSQSTLNCSITSQDASHLASKTAILNTDRGVNEQLNNMSNQVIYNLFFFLHALLLKDKRQQVVLPCITITHSADTSMPFLQGYQHTVLSPFPHFPTLSMPNHHTYTY